MTCLGFVLKYSTKKKKEQRKSKSGVEEYRKKISKILIIVEDD